MITRANNRQMQSNQWFKHDEDEIEKIAEERWMVWRAGQRDLYHSKANGVRLAAMARRDIRAKVIREMNEPIVSMEIELSDSSPLEKCMLKMLLGIGERFKNEETLLTMLLSKPDLLPERQSPSDP